MNFDHNVLNSLRHNRDMGWQIVLTELSDNAIDAGATTVIFTWQAKRFTASDNGSGVTLDGFRKLYTIGGHARTINKKTGRGIGRYGVGFKEAAGWLWGKTVITSACQGVKHKLTIDWEMESSKGQAMTEDAVPTKRLDGTFNGSGTSIVCTNIGPVMPSESTLEQLIERLSHIYRPSFEAGLTISFQRGTDAVPVQLACRPHPRRLINTPTVNCIIHVQNRSVHVSAYISAEDLPELLAGIYVVAVGRVVDQIETKTFSPRLYGFVELGDEWELGKNKTEVTDTLRTELMDRVREVCRPVLKAAAEEALAIRINELVLDVENELSNGLRGDLSRSGQRTTRTRPSGPHLKPRENETDEEFTPWGESETLDDPSVEIIDPDSTAPLIAIHPSTMRDEELCKLEPWPSGWVLKINKQHLWFTEYVQERCFGARGSDVSRLTGAVIDCIAAQSLVSDDVLKALPWLNGAAREDRYSMVTARLWASYLKHRSYAGAEHVI